MTTRVPLLACVAVLSFFAGVTGIRPAYSLAYVLIVLLVVAWWWSRSVARRLEITRESPAGTFMVGEPFTEHFTLRNGSILPIAYCEVRDHTRLEGYAPGRACAIAGQGSVGWTARGAFSLRGRHHFGPLDARVGDPFGLFPRTVRVAPRTEVVVYPGIHPIDDITPLWTGTGAGDQRRGRAVDVPPDVSTVREYDSRDGLSRIHWASTARTGRLMSRTYDTRTSADLLVVLDLEAGRHAGVPPQSSLEYAIVITASLCHAALRRGQAVGLVTNDGEQTALGAGRGERQRLRILEYLATAADGGHSDLAATIARHGDGWRGRGGLVVVTSTQDRSWVEALLEAGVRGHRHLCVFVEPTSFGAPGPAMRIPASWRLALDWWIVRRGDAIGVREGALATGLR